MPESTSLYYIINVGTKKIYLPAPAVVAVGVLTLERVYLSGLSGFP